MLLDRPDGAMGRGGREDLVFYCLAFAAVGLLYLLVFADVPIYGDAWGYGYNCSRWISENGMPLLPSGAGRGESAGGHAAFYFWMWGGLMRLLGDTVAVAHLLPAIFAFLTVAGSYRLGRELSGRTLGVFAGATVLASPLFLAQAFRALPISAAMAATVWSLLLYRQKRYVAAAGLCVFAVMMREQALLLALSYVAAELIGRDDRSWRRIALLAVPVLVPVVNGLSNYLVNGYVLPAGNTPGFDQPFSLGLLLHRLKFFGFFLVGDLRWLPISIGSGVVLGRAAGRRAGVSAAVILGLLGAFSRFTNYFVVALIITLALAAAAGRHRLNRTGLVLVLFPLLTILSFSVIVFLTATRMEFMFLRYLMPAFPALVAAMLWPLTGLGPRGRGLLVVFLIGTAAFNLSVRNSINYSDSTLAGYLMPLRAVQEAGVWAAETGLPVAAAGVAPRHFENPALGYSDTALTVVGIWDVPDHLLDRELAIVVPPTLPWGNDGDALLAEFLRGTGAEERLVLAHTVRKGPFTAVCYILRARGR